MKYDLNKLILFKSSNKDNFKTIKYVVVRVYSLIYHHGRFIY